MTKVKNPITNKPITIGGTIFKNLLKKFSYDEQNNQLIEIHTNDVANNIVSISTKNYNQHTNDVQSHDDHHDNHDYHHNGIEQTSEIDIVNTNCIDDQNNILSSDDLNVKSLKLDNVVFTEIIHISDVHIPIDLHKDRSDEYNIVFNRIYDYIKQRLSINPTGIGIIITGDLLHTKLNIPTETYITARLFLEILSKLAHTILIIGNHDFTENNLERIDSITAICHGLNIHCLKYTGLYRFGNILFSFSSLFDKKFIKRSDIKDNMGLVVYKLYHGTIIGSKNFNNTIYSNNNTNYHTLNDFNGYDAVLLGHIHKYQSFNNGHIAYAGSTIQQHIGESIDFHGFLIWNVHTHTHTFVHIDNDYVFIDVHINDGIIDYNDIDKYKDKKLRIRCQNNNTNQYQYDIAKEELKKKYNIVEIKTGKSPIFVNNQISSNNTQSPSIDINLDLELELIKQSCTKQELHNDIIQLHKSLSHKDVSSKTIHDWNVLSVKFRNIFVYGNNIDNYVDFISGTHNICSPNKTGKSSLMYIIIFALFGQTSNHTSKKANIINIHEKEGYIELLFVCDQKKYLIEKKSHGKKRKSENTTIFETNFFHIDDNNNKHSLNGKDNNETLKIIKDYIGDYESFSTHSIISPKTPSFIYMSPADKLEHLHKLCDTLKYENFINDVKKYKEDLNLKLKELYGKKTILDNNISELNITELEKSLKTHTDEILNINLKLSEYEQSLNDINQSLSTHTNSICSLEKKIIDVDTSCIDISIQSLDDINNNITTINDKLNDIDHDQSIRSLIQNESLNSLNKIIQINETNIVPCKYSYIEVINHINYLKNNINDLMKFKPIETFDNYNTNKTILLNKIQTINDDINTINTQINIMNNNSNINYDINIDNKKNLIDTKSDIEFFLKSNQINTSIDCTINQLLIEKEKYNNRLSKYNIIINPDCTINSLKELIDHYNTLIKPINSIYNSKEDVIDKIESLNIKLNKLYLIKPPEQLNYYINHKSNIQIKLEQINENIINLQQSLPLFPNYQQIKIKKYNYDIEFIDDSSYLSNIKNLLQLNKIKCNEFLQTNNIILLSDDDTNDKYSLDYMINLNKDYTDKLNTIDPNNSIYKLIKEQNQTSHSLQLSIDNCYSYIINPNSSYDIEPNPDIITNKINDLQIQIQSVFREIQTNIDITSLNRTQLIDKKTYIEYEYKNISDEYNKISISLDDSILQISQLKNELKDNYHEYTPDITQKNYLHDKLKTYYEKISNFHIYKKIDKPIEFYINLINSSDNKFPDLTFNEINIKIDIINDKINTINKYLIDDRFNHILESKLSIIELKQMFKKLHIVNHNDIYTYDHSIIDKLQNTKQQLLLSNDHINCDTINHIINSFIYDENNNVLNFNKDDVNKLTYFINSIYNGSFYEILKINNEIEKYNKYDIHNNHIYHLINENNLISLFNDNIQKQINWIEYQSLKKQLTDFTSEIENLKISSSILISQNTIDYLQLCNEIKNINLQIALINTIEYQNKLSTLINTKQLLHDQSITIGKYINLNDDINKYKEYLKVVENNILYKNKITIFESQLNVLNIYNKIHIINHNIDVFNNIDKLNHINNDIIDIDQSLSQIELYNKQTSLIQLITNKNKLIDDLNITNTYIDWFNTFNQTTNSINQLSECLTIIQNNNIYYEKISNYQLQTDILNIHNSLKIINHNINIINKQTELNDINNKLQYISLLEYKSLLVDKLNYKNSYDNELSIVVNHINWYDQFNNLNDQLIEYNKYLDIINNNNKHYKSIHTYKKYLDVYILVDKLFKYNKYIEIYDTINNNNYINNQINMLNNICKQLSSQLSSINSNIDKLNKRKNECTTSISIINNDNKKYHSSVDKNNINNTNISHITHQLNVYNEYIELFKKTNIPYKLMNMKMDSLDTLVNSIFSKYTDYTFKLDQTISEKLALYINNKYNNCNIDIDRICGYESIILSIAINQAILNITNTYKCRFLIIDESLDCIDKDNFNNQLPDIIDTIRNYYQSIIIISHRYIPQSIINKTIKIKSQKKHNYRWSIIDN